MDAALRLILTKIILHYSSKYGLESSLVFSIAYKESLSSAPSLIDGIFASRYEPEFFDRYIFNKKLNGYVPKYISLKTEGRHRATSWGLMQIMGNTARELGYAKPTLTSLILPWRNVNLGCKLIASNIARYGKFDGIRKYNGSITNDNTKLYAEDIYKIEQEKTYLKVIG